MINLFMLLLFFFNGCTCGLWKFQGQDGTDASTVTEATAVLKPLSHSGNSLLYQLKVDSLSFQTLFWEVDFFFPFKLTLFSLDFSYFCFLYNIFLSSHI